MRRAALWDGAASGTCTDARNGSARSCAFVWSFPRRAPTPGRGSRLSGSVRSRAPGADRKALGTGYGARGACGSGLTHIAGCAASRSFERWARRGCRLPGSAPAASSFAAAAPSPLLVLTRGLLSPAKSKFRKHHKGRVRGFASSGAKSKKKRGGKSEEI